MDRNCSPRVALARPRCLHGRQLASLLCISTETRAPLPSPLSPSPFPIGRRHPAPLLLLPPAALPAAAGHSRAAVGHRATSSPCCLVLQPVALSHSRSRPLSAARPRDAVVLDHVYAASLEPRPRDFDPERPPAYLDIAPSPRPRLVAPRRPLHRAQPAAAGSCRARPVAAWPRRHPASGTGWRR